MSLCWKRGRTDLSRQWEWRRWRWGGSEGGRGRKRDKKHGGKWSGKRFSSSLANVLFLHFIRQFTTARKYLWSGAMCYGLQKLCECVSADRQRVRVCPNHYTSYIYSVHLPQQAYHILYHKPLLTFRLRCVIWAQKQSRPAGLQIDCQLSLSMWQWEADCKHLENVLSFPLCFSCRFLS